MELFTLTASKRTKKDNMWVVIYILLALISLFAGLFIHVIGILVAIVFFVLSYFAIFRRYREFEVSYFDGEFTIARVMNKSRRKKLAQFSMDTVIQIAPAGDRSVYKYEFENPKAILDCYSLEEDATPYVIVTKDKANTAAYKVELDDRMLNELCRKYPQKVIRRTV